MATTRKRGKTHYARWMKADKTYGEKGGFKTKAEARLYANQEEWQLHLSTKNSPLVTT